MRANGTPRHHRNRVDQPAVESGAWPPGAKLPSRSQLCKEYGVSDTVVGKAMMILRATGLTETLEGVGVFVAGKP
ncbi:winged helix-turn-helix domain-containing protein [Micromonospora sp. NPDC005254]|uniref:winged helix-turn-helix domain-containing protein n=1 Tax=Micromonospora sp. NPDC005254 TaxID=3364229 RepID=UPI0036A1BFB3